MAIVTGSIERARLKYPGLDTSNLRLIGWGAGQYFRDYYPFIAEHLDLQYTICPRPENHGKRIHGVDVRPPSALREESTENTLIVILALHYPEIMNQISEQHGKFRTVRSINFNDGSNASLDELQDLAGLLPGLSLQHPQSIQPKAGIFVQGLAFDFTPLILASHRLRFPSVHQCMVTWDHQPRELLDRCREWLDELILVPQPENLGLFNRNAVLRSARIGAEHLAGKNIEFAVRCRSDNLLTGSIYEAINKFFSRGRNAGKIAASLSSSWQHVPFHFSEKTMVARTSDMLSLWSRAEDPRSAEEAEAEYKRASEAADGHFQTLAQTTFESYLWGDYAHRLGYPTETLMDSYRFAQARLLALEPHLTYQSLKFVPLFNVLRDAGYSFTLESWNRLLSDGEDALQRAEAVSRMKVNTAEYWQGKVG